MYRVSPEKAEFCIQVQILKRLLRNETSVYSRLKVYSFSFLIFRGLLIFCNKSVFKANVQ